MRKANMAYGEYTEDPSEDMAHFLPRLKNYLRTIDDIDSPSWNTCVTGCDCRGAVAAMQTINGILGKWVQIQMKSRARNTTHNRWSLYPWARDEQRRRN